MSKLDKAPLDKLIEFLNKLFQFESQDLDFGVYKILHYKRKEIKKFIDELLVDKVKKELTILTEEEVKKAKKELKELKESPAIKKWLKAIEENNQEKLKIYEEDFEKEIDDYKRVKAAAESADVSIETQNQIYNHLTLFFSRYYDKGDFISKRRFGKNEKYVVPYNGEETHFYWANHDQYYIKSSEHFQKYSVTSPKPSDPLKVHFKLTEAHVEQGNVKEDENKYFVLSEKEPELENNELLIFFEYRALTEDEKKEVGTQNKQEKLNETASGKLQKKLSKKPAAAFLWEKKDDETYLLKKLNHYTRKNNYDFFIHKNLKSFLQRELDFYIKSELINVDDLYVQETETHFSRVKHNLKSIKVFKNVADTIIEFLAQIEDFQKKLWEKKKFVLSTEWVITIDKLTGWLGEKEAEPVLKEALKNKNQLEEWKELFGEEIFEDWKKLAIKNLYIITEQAELGKDESEEKVWKKLPVDTVHFDEGFKWNLLNKLSDKIDIEENSDGLVIHSDNFHGLNSIKRKFYDKVNCIFIDPPFNLSASRQFLYKVNYKNSSWSNLIGDRLPLAIDLLNKDSGNYFVRCDYHGSHIARYLHDKILSVDIFKNEILIQRGRNEAGTSNKLDVTNEWLLYYSFREIIKNVKTKRSIANVKWTGFLMGGERKPRERIFLGKTIIPPAGQHWSLRQTKVDKILDEFHLRLKCRNCGTYYFKAENDEKLHRKMKDKKNRFKFYDITEDNILHGAEILDKCIECGKDSFKVEYLGAASMTINNNWLDVSGYANNFNFQTENSEQLLDRVIELGSDQNGIILDYFAGSGTTLAAAHKKNRYWIGIEAGQQFYENILPRLKTVLMYDKKGISNAIKEYTGGGFYKYQKLEQYEESLENISFNLSEDAQQKALEFEEYIPKYFLEFETKNSGTLVNTEAMENPWDYKLKVWDGYTYDTQKAVDLVDTFNYLIGLHVQKYITKDIDGKRYQFVYGNNNSNKNILVVWRSIKDWKKEDYEKDREALKVELKNYEYDLLYINGQAHWENYQPVEQVFKSKMIG